MDDAPRSEVDLLTEIARLYAALIRIVRDIDDPHLKAEIAALIWPPQPPPRRSRRMAKYSKAIAALVAAVVILVNQLAADGFLWGYGPAVIGFLAVAAVFFAPKNAEP